MSSGSKTTWQRAALDDGAFNFREPDGLRRALADGFFLVDQPDAMSLAAGDRFASRFYLPEDPADPFCGHQRWTQENLGPRQGYFRRDNDQTEQFFLERAWWERVFPEDLRRQAEAMRAFAVEILQATLAALEIPKDLWDEATGRCLSGSGTYHLTFNHFRPEIRARGLNVHKDSGWVTLLRSTRPGLEVMKEGRWQPITPEPGAFIVNFGCAMEILTKRTRLPVAAVPHRVVEQPVVAGPDRISYGLFVDSSLDTNVCPGLFSYEPGEGLRFETSFDEFLTEIVEKTYQEDTVGLY